jgi:hypothetical protein
MIAALSFLAMIAVDIMWARYIMAAADRRAGSAALYSGGIVLGGAAVTLAYVDSPWNLIPACLGAVAGTYWTVRRG